MIAPYEVEYFRSPAEWRKARHTSIGSSDSAGLFNLSDHVSELSLWSMKTGRAPDVLTERDLVRMETGSILEETALRLFSGKYNFRLLRPGKYTIHRSIGSPWIHASLDAVVLAGDSDRWEALAEAKCPGDEQREYWVDNAPEDYQAQLQHGLYVTGLRRGYIVALFLPSRELRVFEYPALPEYHKVLIEASKRFMELVRRDVVPEPDGLEVTSRALKALYPVTRREATELPPEASEWVRRYQELSREVAPHRAIVARLEGERRHYANRILGVMGDAGSGYLGQQKVCTLSDRKEFVQPATRILRVASAKED